EEPTKAMLGAGAYVMEYHEPLSRQHRDVGKYARYCQSVSRKNPWVNTAEAIISGKASTVPWHLEDAEGGTVNADASEQARTVLSLFERPNAQMTRSRLWSITLRHMGVNGNAFWYLDQLDGLAKTPAAIYYINPARMRPATDARGNLTGWVLDAAEEYEFENGRQTGIPLALEEVVHFTIEPPDWGYLGHGLVEAAENLLSLNNAAERYLTQVLATGGRRGHFIGPKDGRMDDDVFQSLVAGLRNVAESPDAAKRNIVTKGPLEATPQAVTPNEVGAMGVLTEMREDIVSGVWRVPLSQLGIPLPAGLNSGDARKYDEASLWQNAIEPRLNPFAETVQFQLLDRWAMLGLSLNLVLDTPRFDDMQPAWDLLEKSTKAPITWNEQRTLVGLDPLPDYDPTGRPLGVRIDLPRSFVEVGAAPDVHGNFGTVADPITPEPVEREEDMADEQKATVRGPLAGVRDALEGTATPRIQAEVAKYLEAQREEIVSRVRGRIAHLLRKPGDIAWNAAYWDDRLRAALAPQLEPVVAKVANEAASVLGKPQKADPFLDRVLAFVLGRVGDRISGMNETTRAGVLEGVRSAIAEAVEQGLSPAAAADLLGERVRGLSVWNDARAELIARTELMNSYNDAALRSYREYEVKRVTALDGDVDAACASRNGRTYDIDEAFGISDHPNGTLDWAPAKAQLSIREEAI
ncbi:MAG: phage portal protein, partial [Actinomycetota bacterium]|nr:phage portal protein [Actinomycetota bacterium]